MNAQTPTVTVGELPASKKVHKPGQLHPELRVPMEWIRGLDTKTAKAVKVVIGPHPSATPAATMRKTGCDIALRGEPDL